MDSDKYPEEYLKVQESINSRLHSIYLPESPKTLGVFGFLTILLYAGIFISFGISTYVLSRNDFDWRLVGTLSGSVVVGMMLVLRAGLVFRTFDVLMGPVLFQFVWRFLTRTSRLTDDETAIAQRVLGKCSIPFESVRIAEGGLLRFLFKLNGSRAFSTFNIINLPSQGHHSRSNLDVLVHELVHVLQYKGYGSVYLLRALRAQRTEGYAYGGWSQLVEDRNNGKHFCDYNLEQQGQIAQDYCREVIERSLPEMEPIRLA